MRLTLTFAVLLLAGIAVCFTLEAQTTTEVRSGTVLYVEGNDLVVKLSTGETKHFDVPEDFRFDVDGKQLSVHELKPGTVLTRTITTTTMPSSVKTTEIKKGTVWAVQPPSVIVTMADGKNRKYKVPDWFRFDVDGKKVSVYELKKGMNLTATIVHENEATVVETTSGEVSGSAPTAAASAPAPSTSGSSSASDSSDSDSSSSGATLPKTASNLAVLGLLGIIFLALSFRFKM